MILILTNSRDEHANRVAKKLLQRGATVIRLDTAQFPSEVDLSLTWSSTGDSKRVVRLRDRTLTLDSIKSVWIRRPGAPKPHCEIKEEVVRTYVAQECKDLLEDAWNLLNCFWLPAAWSVIRRTQLKAIQLKWACDLGFEIPPTLLTNSPKDFIDFYRQYNGNIVSKLAGPTAFHRALGRTVTRYTEVVSARDVAYAEAIRYCPVIFQAYVPKHVEVRITVVGEKIFAAEIRSQESNHTRHDWRRYDDGSTLYFPHDLPRELASRCVRLVERLGLCFGAIDMVLTPDGRYVFLEINPNGQYLWIERMTSLPISDAICDLLISGPAAAQAKNPGSSYAEVRP